MQTRPGAPSCREGGVCCQYLRQARQQVRLIQVSIRFCKHVSSDIDWSRFHGMEDGIDRLSASVRREACIVRQNRHDVGLQAM
jgi:hypothetical protein